jgi:hypothetical protein
LNLEKNIKKGTLNVMFRFRYKIFIHFCFRCP